jgi:peptidyl-prolyl cis-trans isomerase D
VLQSMRSAAKPIFFILLITFVGGFLFADASGLLGRAPITAGTPVATVDGQDVTYQAWINEVEQANEQQQTQLGRTLSADERARLEQQVLDGMIQRILLEKEYTRRGITVTDREIQDAARVSPPPELLNAPQLQTDGRFDMEKYQRYLSSPQARASGLLLQLEGMYREQIRQEKLFGQIVSDVYVSDTRLWNYWQDTHDSAQVTFAAFRPDLVADSAVRVSDAEVRDWFERHRRDLERPGRATLSVVSIPRLVTATDTAATLARLQALRSEIVSGTSTFEDVARRESTDSISAQEGGQLPRGPRGRFVPAFEEAAYALKVGEVSQPVLTTFGYHLIRVDERKADTIAMRHILVRVTQSDSTATRTDRQADELARLAANAAEPAKFDSAVRRLGLQVERGQVVEGESMRLGQREIPDASAFAFGGARVGETSDLLSDDDGYYLARIDSLTPGGAPRFEDARDLVRRELLQRKKVESLMPRARELATAAASGSLETAASAKGVTLQTSPMFARVSPVPGIGQQNEAIGAAFALPVGAVSDAIATPVGAFVLRVDKRVNADRAAFDAQKQQQRQQLTDLLRRRRYQDFLEGLRRQANVKDMRKEVLARGRGIEEEAQ